MWDSLLQLKKKWLVNNVTALWKNNKTSYKLVIVQTRVSIENQFFRIHQQTKSCQVGVWVEYQIKVKIYTAVNALMNEAYQIIT